MATYSVEDFTAAKLNELKEKGIWNARIERQILKCRSVGHVKNTVDILFRKYSELIELEILADKANIGFVVDFRQATRNIDQTNIKELRKKVSDYKAFLNYKDKCIRKLTEASLPASFIAQLHNAKSRDELKKIFAPLPYPFLREKGLVKPAFYGGITTEKSVNVIYTNMKNQ